MNGLVDVETNMPIYTELTSAVNAVRALASHTCWIIDELFLYATMISDWLVRHPIGFVHD